MSIDNTFNTPNGYNTSSAVEMSIIPELKNFVGRDSSNKLINMSFGMDPQTYFDRLNISRYNTNGTLDISNTVVPVITNSTYTYGIVDKNDKILVTGRTNMGVTNAITARHNVDGTPDTSFNGSGYVQSNGGEGVNMTAVSVAVDSSNNILICGNCQDTNQPLASQRRMFLKKYTETGTYIKQSNSFPILINMYLKSMVLDSSNNIYITGYLYDSLKLFVVKFNNNLELDFTFNTSGYKIFDMVNTSGESIVIDSTGRVVVAGKFLDTSVTPNRDYIIVVRFLANGALDTIFGTNGYTLQSSKNSQFGANVKLQLDSTGKIICLGGGSIGNNDCLLLFRLNSNGQPDNSFNNSSNYLLTTIIPGNVVYGSSMLIESNNKIIVTGSISLPLDGGQYGRAFIAKYGEISTTTTTTTLPPRTTTTTTTTTTKPPVKVTGIKLGAKEYTIKKNATKQLTYTITPNNASNRNVTWKSSNTKYVTVTSSGKIKGVASGKSAIITVTTVNGNKKATAKVTVSGIPVKEIKSSPSNLTIKKNTVGKINIIITPSNATNKGIRWTSMNNKVATVNSSGVVRGVAPGKTTITAISLDGLKVTKTSVTVV
jgi:uncharacterized delta-60 repeat protein